MSIIQNFSVPAGNSLTIKFDVGDGAVLLHNPEAVTWKAYGQTHGVVDDATVILSKNLGGGITVADSLEYFSVSLDPADTVGLLGNYYFEAKLTDESEEVITLTQGIMTVTEAH